ncbi:MAG: DUF1192 domain-containing protein [Alphaproteobacteria bacterium]|nr:DUF1192 domain-containing protein [Alphaproteobacteria bacterium]
MLGDDLPVLKTQTFPRNLDSMSLSDLQDYIEEMEAEIERVREDMRKKKASGDAADAFFN